MDVFISWSGERSRAAAEALRNWLPKIINAIKPWLSSADIDKGARWGTDVATRLQNAKAGIICLTPNNLHSDWILFEAGALSKTLQNTFVCPFLIGLEPSDVKPPLAQFQATKAAKDDVLKLLKTLNTALGEAALPEAHIDEAFEVWWPKLDAQLKSLPPEEGKGKPHRPDRELLEEILALVRSQSRPPKEPDPLPDRNTRIIREMQQAIESTGVEVEAGFVTRPPGKIIGRFGTKKGIITVTLPDDIPLKEVGPRTLAQVQNRPEDGISAFEFGVKS